MKKKLLLFFIALACVFGIGTASTYADSVDNAISQRIDELYSLIGNTYWNDNHDTSCGSKSSGHWCSHCNTTNIVQAQWFKNLFGSVSEYQFANSYASGHNNGRQGWSCAGFARFAEWYIFKSSNDDTITTDLIGPYDFTYNNIVAYAKIGDILRFDDKHSAIYISADSSGVYVMDGNWTGSYNCLITQHTISYSYASVFRISRAQNRDSIAPNPPSNLANIPNGVYSIQHKSSGLYLSAGANDENGYDTILYEFGNNGDFGLDQKFYLERLSNNAYKIISQYDNKVIEVDSLSMNDEAHIQKWNYNGVASQQWYIVDRGDGYYKFINVNSGKAMDIGSYVQQWTDNNTDAQKFKIEAATYTNSSNITNDIYAIQFKKNGLYLSAGSNDENGYDTILYEPGNKGLLGEDQKFYLERLANNAYKIISQHNSKVIEVDNLSYANEAHIQQWNYNNVASQYWVIIDDGNGYYSFINKHSGKALDIGSYVQQWTYNNTDAQKFKIIPINYTVKYNANGGSGAPSSQTKTYLKDLSISQSIPNRAGYRFVEWNTNSSGNGTAYKSGATYSLDNNVILYAQWEEIKNVETSTEITSDNNIININTTISNLNQKAVCITGLYDKNGVLLQNNINDVDSSTGSVNVVCGNDSNAAYVKVFLWDSIGGMKPLTNGEKVNL